MLPPGPDTPRRVRESIAAAGKQRGKEKTATLLLLLLLR
jgi:hypothetical protein